MKPRPCFINDTLKQTSISDLLAPPFVSLLAYRADREFIDSDVSQNLWVSLAGTAIYVGLYIPGAI